MSNQGTTSQSHLAAISHDPMDEHMNAGLDQVQSGRGDWRALGHDNYDRGISDQDNSISMRPLLLAGALGLFAAWIVSGASERNSSRGARSWRSDMRSGRESLGRGAGRNWSLESGSNERGTRDALSMRRQSGPEGASSRADLSLDAMNP